MEQIIMKSQEAYCPYCFNGSIFFEEITKTLRCSACNRVAKCDNLYKFLNQ